MELSPQRPFLDFDTRDGERFAVFSWFAPLGNPAALLASDNLKDWQFLPPADIGFFGNSLSWQPVGPGPARSYRIHTWPF